ncbi:MAG: hypothetical protein FJZ01_15225 [Candidatus Sericytochromatia bacterium]|nr:hypothetical protein [Candidatus Tanganyikabacteria bacterium]
MSQFRRDPLSGRWFVLAAERHGRPQVDEPRECPFCPGHEAETTGEVLRYDDPAGAWAVRIVPNKFADLADPADPAEEAGDALHRHKASAGFADVLIESPDHDATFASHPPEQATLVVRAMQERYRHLATVPGVAVIMPFRNYLPESGASLRHPHGQILASSHLPPVIAAEVASFAAAGRCLGCELAAVEGDGPRAIARVENVMLMTPYASRSAYEILLLPLDHAPDFTGADPVALAAALQDGYRRLAAVLGDVPTNLWIHCRPLRETGEFHWHAHLIPRITVEGAWELGTGLAVNSVPPERAAADLRSRGRPVRPETLVQPEQRTDRA